MTTLTIEQHIVATPQMRGGKPRIEGTRITVADIAIWHFRMGYSLDEIAIKWSLSLASVYAAISYYYDHQNEIDEQIQNADSDFEALKAATPSLIQNKLKEFRSE